MEALSRSLGGLLLAGWLGSCASGAGKATTDSGVGSADAAAPGDIRVSPLSHSFGDVNTASDGPTVLTAPITVENRGEGPLALRSVGGGVTGPDGQPVLSIAGVPAVVEAGQTLALDATFTAGSGGEFEGICTLLSDDPDEPTVEVELRGRALAPGVRAEPDVLDFGAVVTGRSEELVLKIGNEGFGALTVDALGVEGAGFVLLQGEVPTRVETGTQWAAVLQFQPTALGAHSGTLTVHSDDPGVPALVVGLQGTGR